MKRSVIVAVLMVAIIASVSALAVAEARITINENSAASSIDTQKSSSTSSSIFTSSLTTSSLAEQSSYFQSNSSEYTSTLTISDTSSSYFSTSSFSETTLFNTVPSNTNTTYEVTNATTTGPLSLLVFDVSEEAGAPISGAVVTISYSGVILPSQTTNSSGLTEFTVPPSTLISYEVVFQSTFPPVCQQARSGLVNIPETIFVTASSTTSCK